MDAKGKQTMQRKMSLGVCWGMLLDAGVNDYLVYLCRCGRSATLRFQLQYYVMSIHAESVNTIEENLSERGDHEVMIEMMTGVA